MGWHTLTLQYKCLRCGAPIGMKCLSINGTLLQKSHYNRYHQMLGRVRNSQEKTVDQNGTWQRTAPYGPKKSS
jgi:DNA-directed RNA polymerase subunit RPC12/RpoP